VEAKDKNAEWLAEFKKARHNAIYFVENVWNVAYPDKAVELTEEEKEYFYKQFRGVPLLNTVNISEYHDNIEKLRSQGYKDWEIWA